MRTSLQTTRLDLACFQPADAPQLHEIFSDPLTHTIGTGPFADLKQTEDWIGRRVRAFHDIGLAWYALRLRETGSLVGNCGVFIGRTGPTEPEIGFEIRHADQRRGFAREAAQAVLDECHASGFPRVWATIRPYNAASLRVATHLGMTRRHTQSDERGDLVYLSHP